MPKRDSIDAPISEIGLPRKRRKYERSESGGCMAYTLWKLGLFGKCELDDVKKALNSEMETILHRFNGMRNRNGRVYDLHSLPTFI
jgi:hypothetical protein